MCRRAHICQLSLDICYNPDTSVQSHPEHLSLLGKYTSVRKFDAMLSKAWISAFLFVDSMCCT